MSWTNQKPFEVTQDHIDARWSGHKRIYKDYHQKFRCRLCGHKFKVGDTARFVLGKKISNFFVCPDCDGEDVLDRAIAHYEKSKEEYWYLHEEVKEWIEESRTMCKECNRGF